MATWNSDNIILTKLGEQVLSKVQSGVGKLTVSRIVSGAGHVSPSKLYNQSQITDIKQELTIVKYTTTVSQSAISANLTNTGLKEAYDLYQIGIYVTHPDFTGELLYLIAQCDSPDHIPLPGDNPVTLSYDLIMTHSGTKEVVINVSEAGHIDVTTFNEFADKTNTALNGKVSTSDFTKHINNTTVHVTPTEKKTWNGKANKGDIPTKLPADGGNADTVDGLHASDILIDSVSDTAELVTLDSLQGGVPFSTITLSGDDIAGQEIALTACGKNLADLSGVDGKLISGISFAYNDGKVVLNGTSTATTTTYLGIKMHLSAGTYTVSGSMDKNVRVVLRNKSWVNIADSTAGATVTVTSDDYYVHIAISSGTVCDNAVIKPQLERGAVATEYEPYSGSTVIITPDSNLYTVPNDIRQQDGINNVSVSAGEVSVIGVKKSPVINRAWKELDSHTNNTNVHVTSKEKVAWNGKAELSDIPTSLPADGGNADTLDGKHASDFMPYIGAVTDLFTVNKTCICKYTSTTLNTPYKANLTTGATGLCIVNYEAGINHVVYFVSPAGSTDFYTAVTANGKIVANKNWRKVSDNGNAATVNGLTVQSSVPANAVFTDTKVTAVGNHYTPSGGTTTSASGGTLTDITNSSAGVQVVTGVTKDAAGHVTGVTSVALKSTNTNTTYAVATTSANGLMSSSDKSKLDGIATGANNYTHPSYTARTGVPTANATPAFGGTFTVTQPVSDATGHITAMNSRTITIPSTPASESATGLVSTGAQTFAGNKTFNGQVIPDGATAYGTPQARKLSSGTAEKNTTNCPSGAWYGRHS